MTDQTPARRTAVATTRAALEWAPPFCLICRRPVESVRVEFGTMIEPVPGGMDRERRVYNGEVRLVVECHGETWSMTVRGRPRSA